MALRTAPAEPVSPLLETFARERVLAEASEAYKLLVEYGSHKVECDYLRGEQERFCSCGLEPKRIELAQRIKQLEGGY